MKTTQSVFASLAAVALSMAASFSARADFDLDDLEDINVGKLVNTLRGSASGAVREVQGAVGDVRRAVNPSGSSSVRVSESPVYQVIPVPRRTTTRSLTYESQSQIPSSLRSNRDLNVSASSVSYQVDPSSKVTTQDILFQKGSTEFADRRSYEIVMDLARALRDPSLRGLRFIIEGHASAEGSTSSNQRLSQRRAERIVREVVRAGVSPNQLVPIGYGESEATYGADAPERFLRFDRRVVIYRLNS